MEILSSSLTFSPIGYNRQTIEKNNSVQNKDEISELSLLNSSHNQQFDPGLSPDEIKKAFDSTGLSLGLMDQLEAYRPTITHALKTLNVYKQEISQPLLNQHVELITGIDIYV